MKSCDSSRIRNRSNCAYTQSRTRELKTGLTKMCYRCRNLTIRILQHLAHVVAQECAKNSGQDRLKVG